jgi:putative endonuclease
MAGNIKNGLKLVRMNNKEWVVYLVRCADESLYCGITNDIERRLVAHNSGKGAKYTKSRMPVEVAGVSSKMSKSEALKLERQIKKVPAGKKVFELIQKTPL